MSEHTLPEDLSRWPEDSFALLGVEPGASERDLRRAYTRLIRVYKPEHYPEQFRRIREAYEAARDISPFLSEFEPPADVPAPLHESPPPGDRLFDLPEVSNPGAPEPERPLSELLPPSFEEELDEAWDWAVDGDEARAYARLLALRDRYPERSEAYLRLYCLLSSATHLDDQRDPCEHLAQGLRQSGGGGPCHEPYQWAIEENPGEALTGRFAELLRSTVQPGLLVTFVRWRWAAACKQERFEVIGDDLPGLRGRLAFEQEEIWLRLMAFAADQLAWATTPTGSTVYRDCLYEIASHKHLQLHCADVFDRLEFLESAALGWHALVQKGNVPAHLLQLLSGFWTRPFLEIRRGVMSLLAAVDGDREAWLGHLDRVNGVCPHLLALFGQVLDSYEYGLNPDADNRDSAELTSLAHRFLEEYGSLAYSSGLRSRLLAFCLREWIDPDVVAQLALNQAVVLPEARLNKLVNDWPLRHTYRACTLFRI